MEPNKSRTFATAIKEQRIANSNGVLTERLGNGLQNRVERFDSARHLFAKEKESFRFLLFFMYILKYSNLPQQAK